MSAPLGRPGAALLLAFGLGFGLAGCSSPLTTAPEPAATSSSPAAVPPEGTADGDGDAGEAGVGEAGVTEALAALNEARAGVGAQPLTADEGLTEVAEAQAARYADGDEDWDGDLGAQLDSAGFATGAAFARSAAGARDAVEQWLAESDAAASLLDPTYRGAGLGLAPLPDGRTMAVAVVGYRADDGAIPAGSQGATEALELTNAERAEYGLAPLAVSDDLNAAAQVQADHQASILTMTHDGNGGLGERLGAVGYRTGAENVAVGQRSVAEVVQGWIDSPGHHANIVSEDMTEMGFAVAFGRDGRAYYAQTFGTR